MLETMVQMEILLRSPKNTVGKEGRFSTVWDNTVENKCGLRKKPDNLTRNAGVKRNLPDCCTWDGACGNTERSVSVAEKFRWNWVRLALFQMCSSMILHFFSRPHSQTILYKNRIGSNNATDVERHKQVRTFYNSQLLRPETRLLMGTFGFAKHPKNWSTYK